MSSEPISVRAVSSLECRNCGAGAPVDEHFCPQCSRILAVGRHGDYFAFFGLERRVALQEEDLERRFRDLSRKFHPDFFHNASSAERLASLERSSYLNDAYRALRDPVARIEHLLAVEGLPSTKSANGSTVPPGLLEEVFALNEELEEIRELRESGASATDVRRRIEAARVPIDRNREEHERQLRELSDRWDALAVGASSERRETLEALHAALRERHYITNLLDTIGRETASLEDQPGVAEPPLGGG